jgi:hypothetical protein
VTAWIVVLAACGAPAEQLQLPLPEPAEPAEPATPATGLGVTWEMHVEGDQLRIDYTIKNATTERVTVADALRKSGRFNSDEIVVHAADEPDTIAFARAFVWPGDGFRPERPPSPHYVDVTPGAELRGTAHADLPLGASHNFSASFAITGRRTKAVLEIAYYDYLDVDASNVHHAPYTTRPFKLLRGAAQPLAAGVTVASPDDQVSRSHGNVYLPPQRDKMSP